jgi:hypothetical protein
MGRNSLGTLTEASGPDELACSNCGNRIDHAATQRVEVSASELFRFT